MKDLKQCFANDQRILNGIRIGNPETYLRSSLLNNEFSPAVNIKETAIDYQLEVATPGFNNEELKIELEKGILTISAQKEQSDANDSNYKRREFTPSSFKRSFRLPQNKVDESQVSASYAAGILRIVLAKLETVKPKPKRTIEIA